MSLSLVLNIVTDDSPMSKGNLFHNFGAKKRSMPYHHMPLKEPRTNQVNACLKIVIQNVLKIILKRTGS